MTSHTAYYPVTMTTIYHCLLLEFRRAYNQAVGRASLELCTPLRIRICSMNTLFTGIFEVYHYSTMPFDRK